MQYISIALLFIVIITLDSCTHAPPVKPTRYDRKAWNHWTDRDANCLNTRQEILKARSEIPVKIKRKGKKCFVESGLWRDYYYPETLTSPKKIDIDHIIPLKHAHDIGGYAWSSSEKEAFANDPENLVVTNRKYNRRKGAKRVDEWLPSNKAYACKYYRDWMKIKHKYKLPISSAERKAISSNDCKE